MLPAPALAAACRLVHKASIRSPIDRYAANFDGTVQRFNATNRSAVYQWTATLQVAGSLVRAHLHARSALI